MSAEPSALGGQKRIALFIQDADGLEIGGVYDRFTLVCMFFVENSTKL